MEEITANPNILPVEFDLIRRVRDLWCNNVSDDDIRNVLGITLEEWKHLIAVMKEHSLPDNFLEYQKYVARTLKRARDLTGIRNHAESMEEMGTAVKCVQLEAEMDTKMIEVGQKLGVLKPEIIEVKGDIHHNHAMVGLFAHLSADKQQEATNDIKNLAQELITNGFLLNDTGKREGT